MVKAPAIGQRSILAINVGYFSAVIISQFLQPPGLPGATKYGWLQYDPEKWKPGVGIVNGGPTLERIAQGNALALRAAGSWTAGFAPVLEQIVSEAEKLTGSRPDIFIDVSKITKLDTFGAWLIERLRRRP